MPESDLVKTGIAGLDDILSGGIPRGNVILLEGAIGTGKTTLGVEFVYRGASQFDEPGVIVLFEVSPDKLVRDAARFGWDLPALERQGRLKIVFTTRQVFQQELQQADSLLLEEAAEIGARRIFVDGVPGVVGDVDPADSRDAFHVLVEGLQRENLTAVLAVEAPRSTGPRVALPEESIADTVIRLRMEDSPRATGGRSRSSSPGARTSRWAATHSGSSMARGSRCTAGSRRPALRPDQAAAFDPATRVSTGIPGLDDLMNGGYLPRQHHGGGRISGSARA